MLCPRWRRKNQWLKWEAMEAPKRFGFAVEIKQIEQGLGKAGLPILHPIVSHRGVFTWRGKEALPTQKP